MHSKDKDANAASSGPPGRTGETESDVLRALAESKALKIAILALLEVLDDWSPDAREVVLQRLIEALETSLSPENDAERDMVEAEVLSKMATSIAVAGPNSPRFDELITLRKTTDPRRRR